MIKMKALLATTVKNSLEQLDVEPGEDLSSYIRDNQFKILTNPEGSVIVARQVQGYNVTTYFDSNPEQNEDEEFDPEADEENEENEDEEGAPSRVHSHSFDIDVVPVNPNPKSTQNFMRITAYVDPEGVLCLESFGFNPKSELVSGALGTSRDLNEMTAKLTGDSEDEGTRIYFDDMENDLQDQMIDFLGQLGIDDQFAQFVAAYSVVVRTQLEAKKFKSLGEFFKN